MSGFLNAAARFLPTLWEMSVTAAYAAAVVAVLRLLLKRRAPRQLICLLWLVVFARLLIPVSLKSPLSIVPDRAQVQTTQPTPPEQAGPLQPPVGETGPAVPSGSGQAGPVPAAPGNAAPAAVPTGQQAGAAAPFPWRTALAGVWLAGAAAMCAFGLAAYLRLRRRLFDAIRAQDGAWEHPAVASPFILGVFRPRVYLPAGLAGRPRQFILCHERAHLRRLDHIVKPVCWAALALHWFNPLAWAAFLLMSRDIEAACDEAVIRQLGNEVKADYSATLLALATGRRTPSPCPLAFDEGDAKGRIRNVLRYRRPTLWIIVVSVIAAALAAVCLLTDPVAAREPDAGPSAAPSPGASASQTPDTRLNALLDPWMKQVLDGEQQFHQPYGDRGDFNIHQLRTLVYGDQEFPRLTLEVEKLTIMDLDQDGVNEMVVWPVDTLGERDDPTEVGYYTGYFIFRRQGDAVHVYYPGWRSIGNLKADGTFDWSGSAFNCGTGSAWFDDGMLEVRQISWCDNPNEGDENYFVDGKKATAWDFESAMTAQLQKNDPVWYVYENGVLSRILPAIPLDAYVLSAPVPGFLDEEQQLLYRQARALYSRLFGADNSTIDILPGQGVIEPAEPLSRGGWTYTPVSGLFARWDDFEPTVLSVFTPAFWNSKNTPGDGDPLYLGHNGRTYYLSYGRGATGCNFEAFRLVEQTDDALSFVMTGYYIDPYQREGETPEEWQARQEGPWEYSIDFPMRLVKTENGWRFDEFHCSDTDCDIEPFATQKTPNPSTPTDGIPSAAR